MRYDSLMNHFETKFIMVQDHKWSLSDIENLYPWERDIYVILLKKWLDEKIEKLKNK